MKKRLLIVTDAAAPQVNGVVRTLTTTIEHISKKDEYELLVITPHYFNSFTLPKWMGIEQEISFVYSAKKQLWSMIDEFNPTLIHIAVEGPLGIEARNYCVEKQLCFTTAYHTMFPEYLHAKYKIPTWVGYKFMKWFHEPSCCVMVAIDSLETLLRSNGFVNSFKRWSRGVDTNMFASDSRSIYTIEPNYALYVGRVSHEKNIEAFLRSNTPNLRKVIVGDGPLREQLEEKYPDAEFVGTKKCEELAAYYANAAVFVFPSKTDTFGLVMVEALACGTPVVAYNVPSPCDILTPDVSVLSDDEDLSDAIQLAVQTIDRARCRMLVEQTYTWDLATFQFLSNLVPVR